MADPDPRQHWDEVYGRRAETEVSWYQPVPAQSLEWIAARHLAPQAPIIDVGGGASRLVDCLLSKGHTDVAVLDISVEVLAQVAARLGDLRQYATLLPQDITAFRPIRRYALWHDRAVFHFLTDAVVPRALSKRPSGRYVARKPCDSCDLRSTRSGAMQRS